MSHQTNAERDASARVHHHIIRAMPAVRAWFDDLPSRQTKNQKLSPSGEVVGFTQTCTEGRESDRLMQLAIAEVMTLGYDRDDAKSVVCAACTE